MAISNVIFPSLDTDLGWPSYQQGKVDRWQEGCHSSQLDYIAEEVPVALVYNGIPHVVMLATPADIEDFALGFSLTEGIISIPSDLLAIHVYNRADGIEVRMKIPDAAFCQLSDKGRNLTGRTGCGLCGATTLKQAIKVVNRVRSELVVKAEDMIVAMQNLKQHQHLNQLTGAVHAAAWVLPGEGIIHVREDVGRHNALDKLIGLLIRTGKNPALGFIIITSRASYEIIQKTASVGITFLAAISAPTGLALRLAEQAGVTLVGFIRDNQHVVYTHPIRLNHTPYSPSN